MPTDVSCPEPDPNEVVTRRILKEELAKSRLEMTGELAKHGRAIAESNEREFARQAKAIEENLLSAMRSIFEIEAKGRIDNHETRITRLEARRIRKPASSKPHKSK